MKKYVPLRDWACPSYSPDDGRAAKSTEGIRSRYGADGENWTTSAQMARGTPGKGSPTLRELDAQRCQNRTPVNKRPVG
jgi:hypothetical protein